MSIGKKGAAVLVLLGAAIAAVVGPRLLSQHKTSDQGQATTMAQDQATVAAHLTEFSAIQTFRLSSTQVDYVNYMEGCTRERTGKHVFVHGPSFDLTDDELTKENDQGLGQFPKGFTAVWERRGDYTRATYRVFVDDFRIRNIRIEAPGSAQEVSWDQTSPLYQSRTFYEKTGKFLDDGVVEAFAACNARVDLKEPRRDSLGRSTIGLRPTS